LLKKLPEMLAGMIAQEVVRDLRMTNTHTYEVELFLSFSQDFLPTFCIGRDLLLGGPPCFHDKFSEIVLGFSMSFWFVKNKFSGLS